MQLGRYSLVEPLGAGADGASHLAIDVQTDEKVELRVLSASEANPDRWKRITKRLHVAALLRHPAIVLVKGIELNASPPFVAMELSPPLTLSRRVFAGKPLTVMDGLSMTATLLAALSAAHQLGLPHSFISPSRILCDARSSWMLDFTGVSCAATSRAADTVIADGIFIAPEQSTDSEGDAASDIYSLALVLKWLLLGESAVAPLHQSRGNVNVTLIQPEATAREILLIAEPLNQLFSACLNFDPSERPTAREMAKSINELQLCLLGDIAQSSPESSSIHNTVIFADKDSLGFSISDYAQKAIPENLGRFRLIEKLGQGGMGAVYKGEDSSDGSMVAIKILSASFANKPEYRRRFVKEARLLSKVNNPYVANLLEFNDDNGILYLATEFVAGKSVGLLLNESEKMQEQIVLSIASDICRALIEAHKRGIVHRDIKPDNILLMDDGITPSNHRSAVAKLSDFGLARQETQSESLEITHAGTVLGTPLYMSPEQCRGHAVDARSDLYSLGASLFHMLGGRPPYQSETPLGVLSMHISDEVPSLKKVNPAVSEATARIVAKSMAKLPTMRYQDAEEFLEDVERVRRGEPTSFVIHPRLPEADPAKILTFEYEWELKSSPDRLWPYVSNTDRLNHAMGLPAIEYKTQFDPQLGLRRFAQARIAGMLVRWEEHPFEWVEGRKMGVLREFVSGAFKWFTSIVELTPIPGGGTRLKHTFRLEPAHLLGKMLAKMGLGKRTPRTLEKLYRQFDEYVSAGQISNPAADPFQAKSALSAVQKRRLNDRMEAVRKYGIPPELLFSLAEYLEHASDQDVARIRPNAFADRFGLDRKQMLKACLVGVRESLLVLLWDILCPRCRIPSDVKEALSAIGDHGHCEACNLDFDLDFANSVELVFRAHPEIRDVEVRTFCVGGPAFSAHVVAQTRVAGSERFELELALSEGTYRLRGPQLPYQAEFRVLRGEKTARWDVDLARGTSTELAPRLAADGQRITFDNGLPYELLVRIERTASRLDAVTAADASSFALFRDLFPDQILTAGQMASVATVTLLMIRLGGADQLYDTLGDGKAFGTIHEAFRAVDDAVRENGGALIKTFGEQATCAFSDPLNAVKTALQFPRVALADPKFNALSILAAIHRGPAMVANINDRLDYFGSNVRLASLLLELAGPNELLMTQSVLAIPEVDELLAEQKLATKLVNTPIPNYPKEIVERVTISRES